MGQWEQREELRTEVIYGGIVYWLRGKSDLSLQHNQSITGMFISSPLSKWYHKIQAVEDWLNSLESQELHIWGISKLVEPGDKSIANKD